MADNWDDDDSTPPTSFGKTLVTGGVTLGLGRGSNKGPGGFGAVGKPSPFGGMSGDNPGESGGFGSNRSRTFADIENTNSGFGSRDCFCSNGDGLSFAEKKGSSSFGGGFGGGRQSDSSDNRMTGKSGCFKCGEEGHMSRDCTNAGARGGRTGGSGGRGCFKCGEEGHMSRDCTNADARGGRSSGGKGCYKCGEEGHMSRDCPRGGSGGGRNSGACFKCNEQGHQSRDCPSTAASGFQKAERGGSSVAFGSSIGFDDAAENGFGATKPRAGFGDLSEPSFGGTMPRSGFGGDSHQSSSAGGDRDNKKGCFKCGEEGHMSRDCPQGGGAGGGRKSGCFKCGEEGHMSRDCPNAAAEQGGEKRPAPYVPPPLPEDEEHLFATLQKGINFDKYDKIPVECTGSNAPKRGITSFAESDIHDILKENVRKAKYDKPTPIQKWAVPIILGGRDMMACAQTGSGKTAAFLLPVLSGMIRNGIEGSAFSAVQEPQAVVVGPTRELVTQIFQEARKFAYNTIIRPVVVYGGVTTGHQLREVEQGCHIVVGTAGRLLDFIRKGKISLRKVKYFILDEADRMLDMGFLPDMKALANELGMPPKTERQTLMFSATFPEEVQRLAQELLNDYIFVTVGRVGSANTDIEQHIVQVDQFTKRDELVRILNSQSGMQRTLVFVEQKRQADFLASFLSQSEFPTTSIHGDREQREREEALRDFKNGTAPIMVATSVAARGLDIPGVMHVVNFDMPQSIDEYVHRIGRTGRCGNMGKATSFFNPSTDSALARPLVKLLVDAQQEVPDWLETQAQDSHGYGGFTQSASQYGAKDTRHGNFGDKSDGGSSLVPGPSAVADIDDWD